MRILNRFIILLIITACLGYGSLVFAQLVGPAGTTSDSGTGNDAPGGGGGGNNQVISSRDAIALRVVPNPQHLSPLQWYLQNIKVKGAPQSLIVDGYEAVRDGRTVYVNAAKIARVNRCSNNPGVICQTDNQCGIPIDPGQGRLPDWLVKTAFASGQCLASSTPEIYTNIYIISYNQDPEAATTDIFGQLLQFWKFNIDVQNCSNDVTKACSTNAECGGSLAPGGGGVCQATGYCSKTATKACVIDSDCPQSEYCTSKKSTIIRDTKRLSDLTDVKNRLEQYNTIVHKYPMLDSGTYLTNRTVSTWPSWSTTFTATLGSNLPTDPVNVLGRCKILDEENALYEPLTCWNDTAKQFAGTSDPLAMPTASHVYYYQYKATDNSFRFCGIFESGYVQGRAPNSPYCQTGRVCNRSCTNKNCGSDGCGGTCGSCSINQVCQSGHCRVNGGVFQ